MLEQTRWSPIFPRLLKGHKVLENALKALSKKACERLRRHVLGKDVAADAVSYAAEPSAGNALFLEELIRSLGAGKVMEQPESAVAMLQARIGRVLTASRRAVSAASMFGQTLWHGVATSSKRSAALQGAAMTTIHDRTSCVLRAAERQQRGWLSAPPGGP